MTGQENKGAIIDQPIAPSPAVAEMERELFPREEMFNTFFNRSLIGIYIVQDSHFQYVNPRFIELSGYNLVELMGTNSLSLVHPDDRQLVRENAARMLRGERTTPYEYRSLRKDGREMWIMEAVFPVQYHGRRAVLGNYMDITENKEAENQLRESEGKYRLIFESANDIVILIDKKGKIVDVNAKLKDIGGYDRSELVDKNIRTLTKMLR